MVPPGSGDLVDHRLQRVGVGRHQRDGEIRAHEGVDEDQEGQRHRAEGADGGETCEPALTAQAIQRLRHGQAERSEGQEMAEFDHPPASSGFSSRGW